MNGPIGLIFVAIFFVSGSFMNCSLEEQEYFGEILLGIKQVIHSHLKEIQGKFYEKFTNLEDEIRHRDDVIQQLQGRIHELEGGGAPPNFSLNPFRDGSERPGSSSGTGSSNELPFMRGDSLDTIFASSPPSEGNVPRSRYRTKRRVSPKTRKLYSQSWESSDQDSFETPAHNQNIVVSHLTGNLIPDSVVVDIGNSTSSNDSQSDEEELAEEMAEEEEEEEEMDEEEDQINELHSNDWEVRMLAAELDKRESKTSVDIASDVDESDGLLRRRRKRSYTTDTDHSESDVDALLRPRAGSLDQVNLKRKDKARGVFKAMSFDRDKDKL